MKTNNFTQPPTGKIPGIRQVYTNFLVLKILIAAIINWDVVEQSETVDHIIIS